MSSSKVCKINNIPPATKPKPKKGKKRALPGQGQSFEQFICMPPPDEVALDLSLPSKAHRPVSNVKVQPKAPPPVPNGKAPFKAPPTLPVVKAPSKAHPPVPGVKAPSKAPPPASGVKVLSKAPLPVAKVLTKAPPPAPAVKVPSKVSPPVPVVKVPPRAPAPVIKVQSKAPSPVVKVPSKVPPPVPVVKASSKAPPPVPVVKAPSKVPPPFLGVKAPSKVPPPVFGVKAPSKVPPPVPVVKAPSKVSPPAPVVKAPSKVSPPVPVVKAPSKEPPLAPVVKAPSKVPPPVLGVKIKAKARRRTKPKKDIMKIDLFEPKDFESTNRNNNNKKGKKRKSDEFNEQYMPRSSIRLYLRRQNKAQELRMRSEKIRTVEMIKRPVELRDPATKILFLASLGLYPKSESGGGPIVIIKQSSNYDNMLNSLSESSESSEQDNPIIEILSDQDDTLRTYNCNFDEATDDSQFFSEMNMEMGAKEIVSSTPLPKRRKKACSTRKDNVARTTAREDSKPKAPVNRKPLTQRQHNSISSKKKSKKGNNKKSAPTPAVAKKVPVTTDISVKCDVAVAQAQPDFNPCVQAEVPENKSDSEPDKFSNMDAIKLMLARLHTHIAPVEEEIQLITIE